jgi:hypothetical protein
MMDEDFGDFGELLRFVCQLGGPFFCFVCVRALLMGCLFGGLFCGLAKYAVGKRVILTR